jgi:hypothetical protein
VIQRFSLARVGVSSESDGEMKASILSGGIRQTRVGDLVGTATAKAGAKTKERAGRLRPFKLLKISK